MAIVDQALASYVAMKVAEKRLERQRARHNATLDKLNGRQFMEYYELRDSLDRHVEAVYSSHDN